MRKFPWYIYAIGLMLVLYGIALYKRPQETDWTPTLINKDKIPYGTYILYEEMDSIFGYRPTSLRITPFEHCGDSSFETSDEVYMFIAAYTPFADEDVNALLRYAAQGNHVFISSEALGEKLSDTLGVKLEADLSMDSISTKLVNPQYGNTKNYFMPRGVINAYIDKFDTAKAIVLGMNSKRKVNFIMQPFGKGKIFINTVPGMYSNYSILDHGNLDYVNASLSYLPAFPEALYWDEYYKQGREGEGTPLRVILRNPALKSALYLAIAAILLFMIFQSKRRQRIMPVVPQVSNTSVDFVETVSQVYYNQGDHRNIAMKQITYLFEHIRTAHFMDTSNMDEAFADKLAHKVGMPADEARAMMQLIRFIRSEEKISDQHLLSLNNYIQEFHKYANQ